MIIAVDVDNVIFRTDLEWMDWCNKHSEHYSDNPDNLYDISSLYPDIDAFEFWSHPTLYDRMKPTPECSFALQYLHNQGHKIGVVSYSKKGHFGSKFDSIKKHFPFMDFMVATKEKFAVRCDVILDDRHEYLEEMPDDVLRIKFDTPYQQMVKLTKPHVVARDWKDVIKIIEAKGDK